MPIAESRFHGVLPLLLLAVCGFVFAGKIMTSKAALDAGADPFQLGVAGNLGAGLLLLAMLSARGKAIACRPHDLGLYLLLGVVSVAAPVVLSFYVVQRVGPAYTATVYALSPILTMSFAAGIGIERLSAHRSAGIALGLTGMLVLVQKQLALIRLDETVWVIAGLLIPACAATGNIIRTVLWPKGVSVQAFACATLLTSAVVMAVLAPVFGTPAAWRFAPPVAGWLGFYAAATTLSYILNFRLQQIAGPVVFSQIGYWGTGFGVLLAALLFGDRLTPWSLAGLACVVMGGTLANRRRQKGKPVAG